MVDTNSDIQQVKKMLTALLKSQGHIHWIGGFVYGRTSNDDPYIVLYPANELLKEKAVRVYEHDFKKLPQFIPTGDVPGDTDANPNKDAARRRGIYHECPAFQIVTYDGRDTQMGKEKRFGDVIWAPREQPAQKRPSPPPPPPPDGPGQTAVSQPRPAGNGRVASQPDQKPASPETAVEMDWVNEAATCTDPLMFVTAVLKARPWFKAVNHVESFVDAIFGGFNPDQARGLAAGMVEYADYRAAGQTHEAAKARAIKKFEEVIAANE